MARDHNDIIIGDTNKALDAVGGLKVNGVTVITSNGKVVESAGFEISDGDEFLDNNSNEVLAFGVVSSAVNNLKFTNAATGDGPIIEAEGGDTNINIDMTPKGTGYVDITNGGLQVVAQTVTPNTDSGTASTIENGAIHVDVAAVTNDANDWIVLPALASVPVGHTITIACNAGTNFELRTPATSNEKINNVDSDGSQEYLCTDTDTVVIRKISATDGWTAQSFTVAGAVRTAVTPD